MTSNVASVTTKDAAATNNAAKANLMYAASQRVRDDVQKRGLKQIPVVTRYTQANTKAIKLNSAAVLKNALHTKLMNKANKTAGINFGMLSLRISEGLVPVLGILYTSMLPVIAALLAIGSAAVVAMGGIIGLMGVGLYAWSKRFNKSATSYQGARRPYKQTEDANFMDEVMAGFVNVLSDPEIKGMINKAVEWTQTIFRETLPNAFKTFLLNVDTDVIKKMMSMFTNWLPNAARGLAVWGSKLFKLIGPRSLKNLNNFFKYLANGLISTAYWLKESGFEQIEAFSSSLGLLLGDLLDLGKSVLPTLVTALKTIYPMPIKPIIQSLTSLFDSIGKSENATKVISALTGLFVAMAALNLAYGFVAGIYGVVNAFAGAIQIIVMAIGLATSAWIVAGVALTAFWLWLATKNKWFKDVLVTIGTHIINFFIWFINIFLSLASHLVTLKNMLVGNGERVDYTLDYYQFKYKNGEDYGPIFNNPAEVAAGRWGREEQLTVNIKMDDETSAMGWVADVVQGAINAGRRSLTMGVY
jgi:hypothetical protein